MQNESNHILLDFSGMKLIHSLARLCIKYAGLTIFLIQNLKYFHPREVVGGGSETQLLLAGKIIEITSG